MMDRLIIKYQLSIIRYFAILVPLVVQGNRRFIVQLGFFQYFNFFAWYKHVKYNK